jgi:hypothetical protein
MTDSFNGKIGMPISMSRSAMTWQCTFVEPGSIHVAAHLAVSTRLNINFFALWIGK